MMTCRICNAHVSESQAYFGHHGPLGLSIFTTRRQIPPMRDVAVLCGQGCALVATERFLDRGTFEPAPELVEARPVDAYADLT